MVKTEGSSSFKILPQNISKEGVMFEWERSKGWVKVSLVYLATMRDDITLGYAPQSLESNGQEAQLVEVAFG